MASSTDESGEKVRVPGSPTARADHLLERGLELYGTGDLLGALSEWEAALAVDPEHARAREYLDYVRANFEALEAQFEAARAAESAAAAQGVPLGDAGDSGGEAYDSLDVELQDAADAGALIDGLAELDAGLDHALEGAPAAGARALDVDGVADDEFDDERSSGSRGAAVEIEAMAPDEDLPGMAPELDMGPGEDAAHGDDDATIDVRVLPAMRRGASARNHAGPPGAEYDLEDLPPRGSRPGIMTIKPRLPPEDLAGFGDPPPALPAVPVAEMPELDVDDLAEVRRTLGAPSAAVRGDEEEATRAFERPGAVTGPRPPVAGAPPPARAASQPQRPAIERNRPARASSQRPAAGDGRTTGQQQKSIVVPPHRSASSSGSGFLDELPTREHRTPVGARRDDFVDAEHTAEFEDNRKTRERPPFGDAPKPVGERAATREGGASSVIVDERLLQGGGGAPKNRSTLRETDVTSDFRSRRDAPRPAGTPPPARGETRESREERVRQEIGDLLKQAEQAAGKGDFLGAVTAVEAATSHDEEGSVAPVLLHRHRDLLYRIYEGHIGDMHAVPLVAVPLHEIAGQMLDHRTGFLLSRIDGMLSFEDILDVAGMPRMEAYQILSSLLRKGVIEVR